MDLDHGVAVAFAKSFGLIYLIAVSMGVVAYTYWPSRKKQFDRAAETIFEDEDKPWR